MNIVEQEQQTVNWWVCFFNGDHWRGLELWKLSFLKFLDLVMWAFPLKCSINSTICTAALWRLTTRKETPPSPFLPILGWLYTVVLCTSRRSSILVWILLQSTWAIMWAWPNPAQDRTLLKSYILAFYFIPIAYLYLEINKIKVTFGGQQWDACKHNNFCQLYLCHLKWLGKI